MIVCYFASRFGQALAVTVFGNQLMPKKVSVICYFRYFEKYDLSCFNFAGFCKYFLLWLAVARFTMDWVHCNSCFIVPGRGKRFFLTSCGHIYCADCRNQYAKEDCKLCGNPCNSIPLTTQMKPEVEMYFCDPLDLLQKGLKEMKQVSEFQKNHRLRFLTYLQSQTGKTQQLKDDFKRAIKKLQELESEKQKLKAQNEYYKQVIHLHQLSSPSNANNAGSIYGTPSSQNSDKGPACLSDMALAKANSRKGVRNSVVFSPLSENSNCGSVRSRFSIRSPPFGGKMGSVSRKVTPESVISPEAQIGLQNLSLISPSYQSAEMDCGIMSPPSGYSVRVPRGMISGSSANKVAQEAKNSAAKKAAVQPFNTDERTRKYYR